MNREAFLERLSYLEDYHAVPDEFYETMQYKKKRPKNYSLATDSRFVSKCFEYASSKEQGHDIFLTYVSFSIAANMSLCCLQQPSLSELKEMLKIAGYTPDQMDQYTHRQNGIEPEHAPVPRLQPVVFLLAHAIEDAISDKSEWRRRKRYEANPALNRLQKLTAYMEEKKILDLDDWMIERTSACYETFVLRHADNILKRRIITLEMDEAFGLVKNRVEQIDSNRDREITKIMRNPGKKNFAPLANNPMAAPSAQDMAALMRSATDGTLTIADVDKLFKQQKASMPLEVKAAINRAEEEFNKVSSAYDRVLEKTDDMFDELQEEEKEQMRIDYLPFVATGAFRAIAAGEDEIFKLEIGRYIWQDFMTQSTIPLPVLPHEELEDEGEWNEIAAEDNGRLALKIYNEDDLVNVATTDEQGTENVIMPLSAMLAMYAYRTVPTNLYVRKSYINLFKDEGFSDRKARDFAVVMATLASMEQIESANYTLPYENLYDFGEESVAEGVKTVADETKNNQEQQEPSKSRKEEPQQESDGRVEELQKALNLARKANQSCRHEISLLEREVERLKGLLEEKKSAAVETEEEDDTEETASEVKFDFPFRTDLRVVVYGGFEVFHRELLKLIPGIRIIEPSSHVDVKPLRNADIAFLQINKTDHSNYWAVCDACKNAGVPYIHLNYASARRCAEVMVTEIKKIERK